MDFPEQDKKESHQIEADYDANIDKDTLLKSFLRTEFDMFDFILGRFDSNFHLVIIKSISILRAKACHRETWKVGKNPDLLDFWINLAGFSKCVEGVVLECKMFTKTQLVL